MRLCGEMDSCPSTKFLDVDLKIIDVYFHPKEVLVKFQGSYNTECDFDYHILQHEIQQVSKIKESIGIGEFCLVEDPDFGEWHRGRVVKKENHMYDVFLIDCGKVLVVHETYIAFAIDELFHLPPKTVCGIFANILPIEEKWAPKALNYFSSLVGLHIKGHVQAILPHQTFLFDVPKITSDVVELKLGKLVDRDTFRLIVEMLTALPQEPLCNQMPDLLQQKYTRPDSMFCSAGIPPGFEPILSSLQPLLAVGMVEKVKISVAVSPSKFYCQLVRRQKELDELIARMSSCYEMVGRENVPSCDNLGVLCAARKSNGQWHRGVMQQLLSENKVKVWFMDFGSYGTVPSSCVLKLQPEFISVPRFSFPCALSCLNDQDEAVRNNQLKIFKETLLSQSPVHAHIDLFSANEHLYYVTLHKYESMMNSEYLSNGGNKVSKGCPSEITYTDGDINLPEAKPVFAKHVHVATPQSADSLDKKDSLLTDSPLAIPCKRAELKIDSVYVAFVEYVLNPSNFWVQTNDYLDEFETMMKRIADVYDASKTDGLLLEKPEPGKLCCARYNKDMHFYRAVIKEVVDDSVNVYFLDFGNTETVPVLDVRTLLPEFQELPALAICCSLANAFAIQDIWIKKETDFFKKMVFGKPITLQVTAKQNNNYFVSVQCMNGLEQVDLLMCMVQAGYAEYWEVKQDQFLNTAGDSKQEKPIMQKNTLMMPRNANRNKKLLNIPPVTQDAAAASLWSKSTLSNKNEKAFWKGDSLGPYKKYQFKPGMVLDVLCCRITSPGDFSCQIQTKLPELNNLMSQIQSHYNTCTSLYESGQLACVVKHSKDGQWYRAAVLKHVSGTEVDVVFVDFGNWERVLLKDLQTILPDFLTLECQAFRCCLSSVTESLIFDPYKWTAGACRDFERFISSSKGLLTCTISALIFKSPNYLYNLVDLQTPFVSAQQFLLECGHAQFCAFELTRSFVPPFFLFSFYYSSFNVKIGSEEEVCVTHVHSPTKFYCQLNRNADDIDKLSEKMAEISQATSCPSQVNTYSLCLARYLEDDLFYRALAFPAGSSDYLLVYFVDFGNKQLVPKDKLIPIPDHASEILFTPMQAIKCYLSDLRDTDIPAEINIWFEKHCLGKELKAVIVSKESDGQLGVELYDGNLQINKKIQELLKDVKKCDPDPKDRYMCAKKSVGNKNMVHKVKLNTVKTKDKNEVVECEREAGNHIHSSYQGDGQVCPGYGKEIMDELQKESSRTITLPIASENTKRSKEFLQDHIDKDASGELKPNTVDPTLALKEMPAGNIIELYDGRRSHSGPEWNSTTRLKYTNLLQRNIQPNAKLAGYISFVFSPSHFYIYLAEDENKIVWLAEELNGGTLVLEPETDIELEEGDLVLAEYEADCCIYRAVVRQVTSEKSCEVEFIDYGNVSVVNASKIYKMEEGFLKLPRLSIHCFLKAKCGFPDGNWSNDIAAYFVSKVNNQPVVCEFLQQHGQQWEVDLFCHGMPITNELMQKEVSLGSHKLLMLNLDKVAKQLSLTDTDGSEQTRKPESQTVPEVSEPRPTSTTHPKISYNQIKPGQLEIAEMGHISEDGKFFVKLTKDIQTLSDLNVMTAQEADKNPVLHIENIKEGLECLTKSAETLKWHRSEVVKKFVDKENMLVFLMDLGKYEIVSLYNAKMLSSKIRDIPRNSLLCKWVYIENLGDLPFERVVEVITCHEIKIRFLTYIEHAFIWEVDILVDGILLLEYCAQIYGQRKLEDCKLPESINYLVKKTHESSFRLNSIAWAPFQKDRCYPGFVTSVTDPSSFCIQLEDSFEVLKALFKLLTDLPDSLPAIPWELIVPGTSCLIKIGKKWNRVEVSEVSNVVILTFIDDDGLSVPIPISDSHKLKVIPDKLVRLPRLTYPCALFDVLPTDGQQWSDKAKLKIQKFLARQGLLFQFKQHHHGRLEVDVLCGQQSAANLLVASGCAVCYKTAPCLGSINCAEVCQLKSLITCDPLQISNQGCGTIIASKKGEESQQSDSQFKSSCLQVSRLRSPNRRCKKRELQKTHSNKRNDKSLLCKEQPWQTYPTGIFSKAMHDLLALSTEIDGIKICKKEPVRRTLH
ncbi:tudor domain-containing protein 15 isoform X2 [Hemicordylus capensis]|uniref:tudor domain-containing protein 15 isoform X2 n=1 Tax=Hemicordylus capensis TaxID=884348 RepID=UPI0023032DB6|nr:tudor domain-containing protein 15 isoform X2 [Hemicordylus capensis]